MHVSYDNPLALAIRFNLEYDVYQVAASCRSGHPLRLIGQQTNLPQGKAIPKYPIPRAGNLFSGKSRLNRLLLRPLSSWFRAIFINKSLFVNV